MSQVSWTTLEPSVCEGMVSIMMCRENPDCVRIRPSKGDGGIDLIRITEGGWVVYQIKYFAQNLSSNQKSQIKKSFEELQKFAAERSATIAEWHLVFPLDPTKENFLDWFDELTEGVGYQCSWKGLTYLEGLAGTYPEVVDYYVGNGRERLEGLIGKVLAVSGLVNQASGDAGSGGFQPLDTVAGLQAIHSALNAHDPHFRYSFSVDHYEVELPPNEPSLVASVRIQAETVYVTFKVYSRFAYALSVREVPFDLKVTLAEGNESARALEDYTKFGSPVSITSSEEVSLEASLGLPGGLGGVFTSGTVNLGALAVPNEVSNDLRMQILDQDSRHLVTVRLKLKQVTVGFSGEGMRWVGTEQNGVFEIEVRSDMAAQTMGIVIRCNWTGGGRPAEILDGLRAVAAFHAPNQLRFALPYGPITGSGVQLDPRDADSVTSMESVIKMVEALAVIQEHTPVQITVPALAEVNDEIGNELIQVAHYLSIGLEESTWSGMSFERSAQSIVGTPDFEKVGPASTSMPLVARIGSLQIPLGHVRYDCASARLESLTPVDGDRVRVSVVPGPDRAVLIQHVPELPAAPQPG